MEALAKLALDFLYPPVCYSCHSNLLEDKDKQSDWFCQKCRTLLELLTYEERCRTCFDPLKNHRCPLIKENLRVFSCFELKSPISGLVKNFGYSKNRTIATSFAAFIVLQLNQLNIPQPDVVSFIPLAWQEKIFSDCLNQIVAKELGFFLNVSFQKILKASFVTDVRLKKNEVGFTLRSQNLLSKKNILLVSLTKRTDEEWISLSRLFDHQNVKNVHLMQFLV